MKLWRALLVSVPLMSAGSLLAHSVAYRLVFPDGQLRAEAYEETGHAYLRLAPIFFGACVALVLVGAVAIGLQAVSGRGRRRLSPWPFALLPFLMFAVQEHAERLAHTGSFPFDAVLAPTFVRGLLLQIPFALATYLLARFVLRLARGLGEMLAAAIVSRVARAARVIASSPADVDLPRRPALALRHAGRAPPAFSFAS